MNYITVNPNVSYETLTYLITELCGDVTYVDFQTEHSIMFFKGEETKFTFNRETKKHYYFDKEVGYNDVIDFLNHKISLSELLDDVVYVTNDDNFTCKYRNRIIYKMSYDEVNRRYLINNYIANGNDLISVKKEILFSLFEKGYKVQMKKEE